MRLKWFNLSMCRNIYRKKILTETSKFNRINLPHSRTLALLQRVWITLFRLIRILLMLDIFHNWILKNKFKILLTIIRFNQLQKRIRDRSLKTLYKRLSINLKIQTKRPSRNLLQKDNLTPDLLHLQF